jgi:hypothetical protein
MTIVLRVDDKVPFVFDLRSSVARIAALGAGVVVGASRRDQARCGRRAHRKSARSTFVPLPAVDLVGGGTDPIKTAL